MEEPKIKNVTSPKPPKVKKRKLKPKDEKLTLIRETFASNKNDISKSVIFKERNLSKNQRLWLKEVERIKRFEKRHNVKVDIPKTPQRITKKAIEDIKKLRGRKLYDIATVEAGRDINLGNKHYEQGDEVPVSEIIENVIENEVFNEKPTEEDIQSALKDIKTEKQSRTKFSDVYMDEFYAQILDRTADIPIMQGELINVFGELENLLNADNKELFDIVRDFENKQKRDLIWLLRYEVEYTPSYFRDFAGYLRQNYSWDYYEIADYLDGFADEMQNNMAVWEELYAVRGRTMPTSYQ